MKLREFLQDDGSYKSKRTCHVCDIMVELDDEDSQLATRIITSSGTKGYTGITIEELADMLCRMGQRTSATSIRRHRRFCLGLETRKHG